MGGGRPKGGRGNRAYYSSHVRRIPSPVVAAVDALVDEFYQELQRAEQLPTTGEWWEVIGVPSDASRGDVKQAYRQLVKMYHPDINQSPQASVRFKAIQDAYERFE